MLEDDVGGGNRLWTSKMQFVEFTFGLDLEPHQFHPGYNLIASKYPVKGAQFMATSWNKAFSQGSFVFVALCERYQCYAC